MTDKRVSNVLVCNKEILQHAKTRKHLRTNLVDTKR